MSVEMDPAELVEEVRSTVRLVCTRLGGIDAARRFIDSCAPSHDIDAWQVLAEQVGVGALGLPERVGGMGGLPELLAVAEELGSCLLPVPFFSSTVLAGQALAHCDATPDSVLAELAGGATAALAALDAHGRWDPRHAPFRLDDSGAVSGTATAVLGAAGARWIVAATPEALVLVDVDQPGCDVVAVSSLDLTRPAASVTLTAAQGTLVSRHPATALRPALDIATVVLAAEQLAGARTCLDMTVAYAKERRQFSRPIGSFQAVKHTLADALVQVEMAQSAIFRAIDAMDDPARLAEAGLIARIWCTEAFRSVSAEAIQLHGGIGFTWEHDAHLYFRRARADALILGGVADCRERLAVALGW